jgi:UDP-N-acetylglucosamine 4,6-dehydratase (inverting)
VRGGAAGARGRWPRRTNGMSDRLTGSCILVTGGTGSFGQRFVALTLRRDNPQRLVVYSRDELKQWEMAKQYRGDDRVRFFIGDVRDPARLSRALDGIDFVVHAAAAKIVPIAEYNPFECVKTNVIGAMNLIDACIDRRVKRVVALSTDKASSPINLYGASKLASDKLFVAGNSYAGACDTRFAVVRYGNVMGSRGSVIPLFFSLAQTGVLPITHEEMTRFMITLEQGIDLVWHAFDDMVGGEIYVKRIPSMRIVDIARAVAPNARHDIIGVRPGEKMHEQLIGVDDAMHTYQYPGYYKILPAIHEWSSDPARINSGRPVPSDFSYCSNTNPEWMSIETLREWIEQNHERIGTY